MKITKCIDLGEKEVEIEIGTDDVLAALLEGSENYTPKQAVFCAANSLAQVFRKLPDSSIAELTPEARGTIANFLYEQEQRFRR